MILKNKDNPRRSGSNPREFYKTLAAVGLTVLTILFYSGSAYAKDVGGWAGEGQRTQMEQPPSTERKEVTEGGLSVSGIFTAFLGNVKERVSNRVVIYSPVPVRLSGGVKPVPSAVFELPEEEIEDAEEKNVLGVRKGELPTVYFYFENEAGLKVYSLEGEWAKENTVSTVDSKDSESVTKSKKPEDAGEVWGERIASAEEEIMSWTRDTGVILSVIVLAGLSVLGVLVLVIRKLVT